MPKSDGLWKTCIQCSNVSEDGTSRCRKCKEAAKISRTKSREKKIEEGKCVKCSKAAKENCLTCQDCIVKSSKASLAAYYNKKEAGTCRYCKKDTPCVPGKHACARHLEKHTNRCKDIYRQCKENSVCYFCPDPKPPAYKQGEAVCEKHRKEGNARLNKLNKTRRQQVLNHYGRKCACCGLAYEPALQIDHIHGGGTKHRKEIGLGQLYKYIIKNNFPDDYQTLCILCNGLKGKKEQCPHATWSPEAKAALKQYIELMNKEFTKE